jgi:hypothetical protein
MRMVSMSSAQRLDGRKVSHFRPKGAPAPPNEHLVVSAAGVGLETPDGSHVHVEFERCAGALAWRDGSRILFGHDGFAVTVLPWEWKDGQQVVAEIDAKLGKHLIVPMGEGDGPPPAPAQEGRWRKRRGRRAS